MSFLLFFFFFLHVYQFLQIVHRRYSISKLDALRHRQQDKLWHPDVITNCTQGSTNTKHSQNKAAPQPGVEAAAGKPLLYRKITTGHVLICFSLVSFFVYLWLLRHARSPTMPRTLASPPRSTATVMNYANPLVLFRVP